MKEPSLEFYDNSTLCSAIRRSLVVNAERLFTTFRPDGLTDKYVDWTYADLAFEVSKISKRLNDCSNVGDSVCLMFDHSGLAYASMLACILTKRTFVPLNLRQPPARLSQIIMLTQSKLLVTDNGWFERAKKNFSSQADLKIVNLETYPLDFPKNLPSLIETTAADADFPAYILFTSGSTGEPKGVVVSHANLHSYLQSMIKTFDICSDDRLTQQFEFSFDSGIGEIFHGILSGASLHPLRSYEVAFITKYILRVEPTVWSATPSMLAMAKKFLKPAEKYNSVRLSFFMGERLTHEAANFWKETFPSSRIFNLYGPTETTVNVLFHEWNEVEEKSQYGVPIGKPIGVNQVSIVNESGYPADPEEIGEICISGSQVSIGYLHSLSKAQTYRSGDFAFVKNDVIHFVGRKDDQVKIRGFRLDLNEVEFFVRQNIPDTNVIAFITQEEGYAVLGLLLDSKLDTKIIRELCDYLGQNLPSYAVPKKIYYSENWPLSLTGKTDRSKIDISFLKTSAVSLV